MNAFMLFAQQARRNKPSGGWGNHDNAQVSRLIGTLWNELSQDKQLRWKIQAYVEKLRHSKRHPNYSYQPKVHTQKGNVIMPVAIGIRTSQMSASFQQTDSSSNHTGTGNSTSIDSSNAAGIGNSNCSNNINSIVAAPKKHTQHARRAKDTQTTPWEKLQASKEQARASASTTIIPPRRASSPSPPSVATCAVSDPNVSSILVPTHFRTSHSQINTTAVLLSGKVESCLNSNFDRGHEYSSVENTSPPRTGSSRSRNGFDRMAGSAVVVATTGLLMEGGSVTNRARANSDTASVTPLLSSSVCGLSDTVASTSSYPQPTYEIEDFGESKSVAFFPSDTFGTSETADTLSTTSTGAAQTTCINDPPTPPMEQFMQGLPSLEDMEVELGPPFPFDYVPTFLCPTSSGDTTSKFDISAAALLAPSLSLSMFLSMTPLSSTLP
jgi:hypothetical protein